MRHPFAIVEDFEQGLSEYTGAPWAVGVSSGSMALYLSLVWMRERIDWSRGGTTAPRPTVSMPARTYVGVAQAALRAGYDIHWRKENWLGAYDLWPTGVVDAARRLTAGMYQPRTLMCLSFGATKHLPIGRGGAILTDAEEAREWLRRARNDGREPYEPRVGFTPVRQFGLRAAMDPEAAARGLLLLWNLPQKNEDQVAEYDDLSGMEAFQ